MPLYPAEGLKHFWLSQAEEDLSFEELLAEISARLVSLPSDQVDRGIEDALRLICTSIGINQSTIFLREIENPDVFVLSYVLRDPDLSPPPTIKFTAGDNFPWSNKKLIANEITYLPDTQAAPEEAAVDKASWGKYNVVSTLAIPLSTGGGRPLGFWGIDSTTERREWPERLQKRLRIIAGVFAATIERAVSDRQLRESEARLRLAADAADAGFWTMDPETGAIWATAKLKELLGLKPDDVFNIDSFRAIVHPEDRKLVERAVEAMIKGEDARVEYRIVTSSGDIHWIVSRGGRQVFAADNRSLLMGITVDITERHVSEEAVRALSSRLIDAQEEERKRIARELHDGVNQQVAMIAIGLQRLRSGELEAAERLEKLTKLCDETSQLASDIQALSHQLHAPSLDYLGLAATIRGMCREISEHQRVRVHYVESNMPKSVPSDVALAIYRITQEALHNALKYSGVRDFTVALQDSPSHIELMVSDKGVGFDVERAIRGQGLGLISMRERIFALKGTLSIESQPMSGTRILAHVPLVPSSAA